MKKLRLIGLTLVLCLTALLFSLLANNSKVFAFVATNSDDFDNAGITETVRDLFGEKRIKSMEYLYNFNDSPDYIYVDFDDYGYAVFRMYQRVERL